MNEQEAGVSGRYGDTRCWNGSRSDLQDDIYDSRLMRDWQEGMTKPRTRKSYDSLSVSGGPERDWVARLDYIEERGYEREQHWHWDIARCWLKMAEECGKQRDRDYRLGCLLRAMNEVMDSRVWARLVAMVERRNPGVCVRIYSAEVRKRAKAKRAAAARWAKREAE